jgi:hypothetical protein
MLSYVLELFVAAPYSTSGQLVWLARQFLKTSIILLDAAHEVIVRFFLQ